jgi:hypothetical protein
VSDVAGRETVAKGEVLHALSSGGEAVWSEVTMSDGRAASFRADVGRGGKRQGVEGVFLDREVLKALTGSAKGAREFLLAHACGGIDRAVIDKAMPLSAKATFDAMAELSTTTDAIDLLQEVQAAAVADSKTLSTAGAPEGSVADVDVLQRAVESAREHLTQVATTERSLRQRAAEAAAGQSPAMARTKLAKIKHAVAAKELELVDYQGQLSRLTPSMGTTTVGASEALVTLSRGVALNRKRARAALAGNEAATLACSFCGTDKAAVALQAHTEGVLAKLDARAKATQAANAAAIEASSASAQERTQLERKVSDLTQLLKRAAEQIRVLAPLADAAPTRDVSAADIEQAEEAANDARASLAAAESAWTRAVEVAATHKAYTGLRAEQGEVGKRLVDIEALVKALDGLVKQFVDDALTSFCERVSMYLPDSDKFALRLTKTSAYLSLERKGKKIIALSGAEWARVVAAVASALASKYPQSVPVLIVLPDRAWDPKTLRAAMQALLRSDAQVILTSTIKPHRGVPKGWSTVELAG